MLDSIEGTLLETEEDFAVVDVNGLRLRCDVSGSTHRALPAPGARVALRTRLSFNMNEGTFSLFGFATAEERECFDVLTGISGIGPRKALMMLSQIEIAAFANAILRNDLSYLASIKGVGKKTAERLVVELREKMVPYAAPDKPAARSAAPTVALPPNQLDAVQALMVLGCRQPVAERAVAEAVKALGEDARTEDLIRDGLKRRGT